MPYLNSLMERLRPVAREVLSSDVLRSVNLTNMNRYTRIYLRLIVQRAKQSPFNLTITDRQLARLFRVSLTRFQEWFRHNIHLSKVFRRTRWFLREMITTNILEDRGELNQEENQTIQERPIQWPNRRTKAMWRERVRLIRVEYENRGPEITNLDEAIELIQMMQDGYSSSFSIDSDDTDFGEAPDEVREVQEGVHESAESRALNGKSKGLFRIITMNCVLGPPVIIPEQELLDSFKNIRIATD